MAPDSHQWASILLSLFMTVISRHIYLFILFFFDEQLALEYFPLWYPRERMCSEKVSEWLPCPLFGWLLSLSLPVHKWNPDYLSYETFFLDFVIQKLVCHFYALSYQKRFLQFISFSLEFHCNKKFIPFYRLGDLTMGCFLQIIYKSIKEDYRDELIYHYPVIPVKVYCKTMVLISGWLTAF